MYATHRFAASLALSLALCGTATAQAGPGPDAIPDAATEARPLVWTGRRGNIGRAPEVGVLTLGYGGVDASWVRLEPARSDRLREEWVRLCLAAEVDGSSPELEQQRLELWLRAADAEGYPGQWELLVEMAARRALELARAGDVDGALAATGELLPPARLRERAGDYELAPASDAQLAAQAEAAAAPRLAALRGGWQRQSMAQNPAQSGERTSIDAIIRGQVERRQVNNVLEFGARAVPVLTDMVRDSRGTLPDIYSEDPVYYLVRLADRGGLEAVTAELEQGDYLYARRLIRALWESQVLDARLLEYRHDAPRWELSDERWRTLVGALAARPDVFADAAPLVSWFTARDLLTPDLSQRLGEALCSPDPMRREAARTALGDPIGLPSTIAAFEAGLESPDADTRLYAARGLTNEVLNASLRACIDDPDGRLRSVVANSLRPGALVRWSAVQGGSVEGQAGQGAVRSLRPEDLRDLRQLLQDEDPWVLAEVLHILKANPQIEVSSERLVELARHPDARVRTAVLGLTRDGAPLPEVCAVLAASERAEDLQQLDNRLKFLAREQEKLRRTGQGPVPPPAGLDAYLPALRARLANPAAPVAQAWSQSQADLLEGILRGAGGTHALLAQALESGDRNWQGLVNGVLLRLDADEVVDGGLGALQPGETGRWLAATWPATLQWRQLDGLRRIPAQSRRDLVAWLDDPQRSLEERLLAAVVTADLTDTAWRRAFVAGLESADWPERDDGNLYRSLMSSATANQGGPAGRLELLRLLLSAQGLPDWSMTSLTFGLVNEVRLPPEVAEQVLQRWGGEPHASVALLAAALDTLEATAKAPRVELFANLLRHPEPDVRRAALINLGRLHHAAYLPLLEQGLRSGYYGEEMILRDEERVLTAQALASYLDEDAAEILLRGVGWTTNPGVREACFAGLDTIRRYQDETARWAGRRTSEGARADAVRELLVLLDDPDATVRAQAARSLGTLGAVQELPRLVRLLKDPDAKVRAAAQAALDVLNRREE